LACADLSIPAVVLSELGADVIKRQRNRERIAGGSLADTSYEYDRT
jgi:hypothetical protein